MHPSDNYFMLDVVGAIRRKQWGEAAISILVCVTILVLVVVTAPFRAAQWIWVKSGKLALKFRWWLSDILRPRHTATIITRHPTSDLVRQFVEYETLIMVGKEATSQRVTLIRNLAHLEQELEEHRQLAAAIRRLRRHTEQPRRREAILAQRERMQRAYDD